MACPLLQLPAELRNEIWQLAVVRDESILIFHLGQETELEPALLATCKQIRSEAQVMFYSENTFDDHCSVEAIRSLPNKPTSLLCWLSKIGNQRARMIKHLVITICNGPIRLLGTRPTTDRHATSRAILQLLVSHGLELRAVQVLGPRPGKFSRTRIAEHMAGALEAAKGELMADAMDSRQ